MPELPEVETMVRGIAPGLEGYQIARVQLRKTDVLRQVAKARLIRTGKVDPTPMTTHHFAFDQIERAFEMMTTKEDGIIKPLIEFG